MFYFANSVGKIKTMAGFLVRPDGNSLAAAV
jgi:hypothetical protein